MLSTFSHQKCLTKSTDGKSKTLANVFLKQGTSDEKQVPAHADEDLKFCANDGSLLKFITPFTMSVIGITHFSFLM